uniref:Ovule protein n=1 Tax=Syphacia muris TaxID=451379 RepID=A0A0N5B169_9BILA
MTLVKYIDEDEFHPPTGTFSSLLLLLSLPKCSKVYVKGPYDELHTIHKTSSKFDQRLPMDHQAGYIVISFKLLKEQTQCENLEKSWLNWSGAREIYKYSPPSWNLRRISLHRISNISHMVGLTYSNAVM